VLKAAHYLNVPPWDLQERSHVWLAMAEEAMEAEQAAQAAHEKQSRRR
jgi:hypothetical protein